MQSKLDLKMHSNKHAPFSVDFVSVKNKTSDKPTTQSVKNQLFKKISYFKINLFTFKLNPRQFYL